MPLCLRCPNRDLLGQLNEVRNRRPEYTISTNVTKEPHYCPFSGAMKSLKRDFQGTCGPGHAGRCTGRLGGGSVYQLHCKDLKLKILERERYWRLSLFQRAAIALRLQGEFRPSRNSEFHLELRALEIFIIAFAP